MHKISKRVKDTKKVAEIVLKNLKPQKTGATIVGLYGDLGTGKTTFVQYLAKQAGVKRKVNSPTFVIMRRYLLPLSKYTSPQPSLYKKRGRNFKFLFHIDAYRLKNEKELLHLGWDEIISNKEHIVFIEWPERIIKALPKKHHQVHIFHTKEGYRKFRIKKA